MKVKGPPAKSDHRLGSRSERGSGMWRTALYIVPNLLQIFPEIFSK